MRNSRTWLMGAAVAVMGAVGLSAVPAQAGVRIYATVAPPAPRHEVVPALRPGYAWAPGYWNWRGHRYVWVRGHRMHARRGYHYAPARWEQHGNRWRYHSGRWDH